MYLTRSGLSRLGVFLLVTNFLVTIVLSRFERVYLPDFLKVFSELVFAESSCVTGRVPSFTAPTCVYRVTPFLYAEVDAPVVAQGSHLEYAPVSYP